MTSVYIEIEIEIDYRSRASSADNTQLDAGQYVVTTI